jgi:hypothetical protein
MQKQQGLIAIGAVECQAEIKAIPQTEAIGYRPENHHWQQLAVKSAFLRTFDPGASSPDLKLMRS